MTVPMTRRSALLALSLLTNAAVQAAPVSIDLRGTDGAAPTDAVVMVEVPNVARPTPRGPYAMEQKSIAFQPHVLVVPAGATVAFPNRDAVRHHVYSFSKAKTFDLKLYGREDQRSVTFDRGGVVALGCNIHDVMSGFVIVTDTPFWSKAAAGHVTIADVPAGAATLRIWSPSIHAPGNVQVQRVTIAASGLTTSVTLK